MKSFLKSQFGKMYRRYSGLSSGKAYQELESWQIIPGLPGVRSLLSESFIGLDRATIELFIQYRKMSLQFGFLKSAIEKMYTAGVLHKDRQGIKDRRRAIDGRRAIVR